MLQISGNTSRLLKFFQVSLAQSANLPDDKRKIVFTIYHLKFTISSKPFVCFFGFSMLEFFKL